MRILRALTAVLCLGPLMGAAQLSEAETKGVIDTLFIGNFRVEDLKFERKTTVNSSRLPLIVQGIDDPLGAADQLMMLHGSTAAANLAQLLATANSIVGVAPPAARGAGRTLDGISTVPETLRPIVADLVHAQLAADQAIRTALKSLTPEEQRVLIEGLPVLAIEEPRITFEFVRGTPAPPARLRALLAKIDVTVIRSAAEMLATVVESSIPRLRQVRDEIPTKLRLRVGGLPIVIAGRQLDEHVETDARLTIDLGGNDRYTGRHGAGVGYSSVLIDLAGDDSYDVRDLSVGAGLLGIGIARDLGGHDTFRTKSLSLGCGIAGVGLFAKDGGHDLYQSTALSQGFAMYGVGVCLDTNGNDVYQLKLMGQGAGRTNGVGWLVDRLGSDQYRAGGLILNSPLFATAHYSFAQGFGMGFREDTGGHPGGVGLLTDHGGDDFYLGETYVQAASYWFALGSLYDTAGNDTYTAHHYAQSSAMHATGAYLFDLAGDDGYLVKVGAAHAIGHDYGVAFLLDRAGDDLYASRDSSPGIGVANGLAVFIEGDGIDRYHGPPGKGNPARGTGSLGVFVDLNGPDMYRFGLADSEGSATPGWGVAYDMATRAEATPGETPSDRPKPTPGSKPKPADDELAKIYTKASQWNVGTAQGEVADALDELVSIGKPALEWMLANRLAAADRLQIRTFVHVVRALGPDGGLTLGQKAFNCTDEEMRNVILIAMDAGVTDIGALLPNLMEKPALQALAIRAAGVLKAKGATPALMRALLSEDRMISRMAMISLQQCGDEASVTTARSMLQAVDMPTRKAAMALIAAFPEQASAIGTQLTKELDEARVRSGIELLGTAGGSANLKLVATFLLDPRPGVRISALQQLDGRCPSDYRANFESLKKDPVATVRAVAARVRPDKPATT